MASEHSQPAFTAVRRVSPTQQVREQLLSAIQRGDYPPGSAIPSERVLCESFGVSRVSVREALAGLESMGLIRIEHGRGAFVRESVNDSFAGPFGTFLRLHRAQLVELFKVRGALDELAVTEAAERVDPAGVERLQEANDVFRGATERSSLDFLEIAEADAAFHQAIAEVGGGELLPRLTTELNSVMAEPRRAMLARPGQAVRSVREHQAIVDAVGTGNVAAARRALRRHLAPILEWLQHAPEGEMATDSPASA